MPLEEARELFLFKKINEIIEDLRLRESILIAFSGGVDSSLAAKLAYMAVGEKALAVTADSVTLPPGELEQAKKVAEQIGINHMIIKVNELDNSDFIKNNSDRCYFCKKELSAHLWPIAQSRGVSTVITGVIADDLTGHRPGIKALEEDHIYNALANAGLTKVDVREMSRLLGLSVADKPSMACLSSRVSYGEEITQDKLARIGEAETFIKQQLNLHVLRVRVHGSLARIEVGKAERKMFFDESTLDAINTKLRELGFLYVTFDLCGYRSGSMDDALNIRRPQSVQLPVLS